MLASLDMWQFREHVFAVRLPILQTFAKLSFATKSWDLGIRVESICDSILAFPGFGSRRRRREKARKSQSQSFGNPPPIEHRVNPDLYLLRHS